jgi:uncharacterized protein YcnI
MTALLFLQILFLLWFVGASESHVTITPVEGRPGLWDVYVLSVPTEGDSPTVRVELVVPQSHEIEAVGYQRDWTFETERTEKGLVRRIQWRGGKIPPLTFNEFKFYAKNPKEKGAYWWTAYQKLENGQESTWSVQTFVKDTEALGESGKTKEADAKLLAESRSAMTLSMVAIGVTIAVTVVVAVTLWQTAGRGVEGDGKGS